MRWARTFFVLAGLSSGLGAAAQERLSLVIANQQYSGSVGGRLPATAASAELVEKALKQVQFVGAAKRDVSLDVLKSSIEGLAARAASAGPQSITFLYFAGHGLSDRRGGNYILPVDIVLSDLGRLKDKALSVEWIVGTLHRLAPDREHIVVLDACRAELKSADTAGIGAFSLVRTDEIPPGVLLAYSTDLGESAPDSTVYAQQVGEAITLANLPLPGPFAVVREKVEKLTRKADRRGVQPWVTGKLRRQIMLGHQVDTDVSIQATDKKGIVFYEATRAHKAPQVSSGIVEIRPRGTVVAAPRPGQIFLARGARDDRWVYYQSTWGFVYVQLTDTVRLY
jgi:hypothetical protein